MTNATAATPVITALCGDMRTFNPIISKVVGTAPNRCLVVQYSQSGYYAETPLTNDLTYQVRLYETGHIEYVYGSCAMGATAYASGYQIGFATNGSVANTFQSVTSATNSSSFTAVTSNLYTANTPVANLNSAAEGSRRVYLFTPPPSCVVPPDQVSGLTLSPISTSQIDGSFSAAGSAPTGYLVVGYLSPSTPTAPVNGVVYSPGNALGSGIVVQSNATTSFSAIGLTANTAYDFYVYTYNNTLCYLGPRYNAISPVWTTASTLACGGLFGGTYTVGPTGTYPSLTAAMTDVNAGLTGPVVLELQATYTSASEPGAGAFTITLPNNPCIGPSNTLTIRPELGAVGLVISSSIGAAPTIDFNGARFVTIDGRPGGAGTTSQLSIRNTAANGVAMRFINDATFNNVNYCDIQGQNTSATSSALSGVVYFSTASAIFLAGNDNNTIFNCSVHATSGGTPAMGIVSYGTQTAAVNYNDNCTITNCRIYDYFSATVASTGVKLDLGTTGWTISNNSFYQTVAGRAITTAAVATRALWVTPNTASLNDRANAFVINGNYIGANPAIAGAVYSFTSTTTAVMYGMDLSVGLGTATSVQNNTIANISNASTSIASPSFAAISVANGNVNIGTIAGNTIGSGTGNGSITLAHTGSAGTAFGIRLSGGTNTTLNAANNTIGSITINNGAISNNFVGIGSVGGTTTTVSISNNTIGSTTTSNSINLSGTGTATAQALTGIAVTGGATASIVNITGNTIANLNNNNASTGVSAVRGIQETVGVANITGNTIFNLSSASPEVSTGASSSALGITMNSTTVSGATGTTISQNTIYNISNTSVSTTAAVQVTGIFFSGPTTAVNNISRNFIHSLNVTAVNSAATISGMDYATGTSIVENNMIRLGITGAGVDITTPLKLRGISSNSSTTNNTFRHNSIYIGGNNVTTTATQCYAFIRTAASGTYDIRNNIFVNNRSSLVAGTSFFDIYFTSSATGVTLNYNDYYNTGTGGLFAYSGVANVPTYSSGWIAGDVNSFASDPYFINPTGSAATLDLHINAAIQTIAEQTGTPLSTSTVDFDNQTRASLTPVDLGADAGNFIAFICTGTPIAGTTSASQSSICGGQTTTLSLAGFTSGPGISFQWQESAVSGGPYTNISGATNTVYSTPALFTNNYYVCVVTCSNGGSSATSTEQLITVNNPLVNTASGNSRCGAGTVDLTATGTAGATMNWYAAPSGGAPLFSSSTPSTFTTPVISSTTNYYVSASAGGFTANVGKPAYNTTDGTNTAGAYLIFDAFTNFNLNSVLIYPYSATNGTAGTVTISWQNSSGVTQQSTTVNVTGFNTPTATTVPINFNITPGTSHRLVYTSSTGVTAMYRDFTLAATNFPYTLAGVVSITNSSISGYYYYFYNWSVSTGCESARQLVTATVLTSPSISVTSGAATVCTGNQTTIEVSSTNGGYTYAWTSTPAGYSNTGNGPHTVTINATTTYNVLATDNSGGTYDGCGASGSVTITAAPNTVSASASATPSTICNGGSSNLNVVATAGGNAAAYTFSASSGSFTPLVGGAVVSAIHADDAVSAPISIGFNFVFEGATYSQLVACSNGTLFLGATGNTTTLNNLTSNTPRPFLAPLSDDMQGSVGTASYLVTGSPGSRVFTFEWLNWRWYYTVATSTISFQCKLYEADGKIEYIYRQEATALNGSEGASIGLAGATSGVFLSLNNASAAPAASSVTETATINAKPATGQVYTFMPPVTGSFTYLWSPATYLNSTSVANPTASGVNSTTPYSVLVTNSANGCTRTATATVTVDPLSASASASSTTVCVGQTVTLDALVAGGGTPYSYSWSDGTGVVGTTLPLTLTPPAGSTTYTLTVQDACSPTGVVTTSVTVNAINPPSVSISSNPLNALICGTGSVNLTASGATSYAWLPATGLSATNIANPVASPTTTTTYTVTGTTGTCSSTATKTVTVAPAVNVAPTSDANNICDPMTTQIHANATGGVAASVANYTFAATSGTFTPLAGGTPVTAILADDAVSAAIPLSFNFVYEGVLYSQVVACSNGTLFLGTTGNTTTLNNLTTNTPRPFIAPLSDDMQGSVGTASYLVTGSPGSRVFTFEWLNWRWYYTVTTATISFQCKLYEADGKIEFIYRQEATALNASEGASIGLAGATSGVFLSLNNASASPTASSVTETSTINTKPANGQVYTFTPPVPVLTYSWSPTSDLSSGTVANPDVTNLHYPGQTYTVVATAPSGCSATGNVNLNVLQQPPQPTITPGSATSYCPGGSVTLQSSTDPSYTNYSWNNGGPSGAGATSFTVTGATNTVTTYVVTVSSATGCTSTQSQVVTVYDTVPPVITVIGSSNLCTGQTTTDLQADVNGATGPAATYLWSTGETTNLITVSTGGTYSVVTSDIHGCYTHQQQLITESAAPPAPIVTPAGPINLCSTDGGITYPPVTLTCSNYSSDLLWSTSETTQSIVVDYADIFNVSYTDPNGCFSTSNPVTTNALLASSDPTSISSDITSNISNNICLGNSVILTVNGGSLGDGADWYWYEGTGACGTGIARGIGSSVTITPATAGIHHYTVRAQGDCGPTACVSIDINVSTASPTQSAVVSSAPAQGCNGTVALMTLNAVANATFYSWNGTSGALYSNNIGGPFVAGPYQTSAPQVYIQFLNPAPAGNSGYSICAFAGNACGQSNTICKWVRSKVSQPGVISGSNIGCPNTNGTYSVAPVIGADTYTWTVSGNAGINGGGTTLTTASNSITVNFGAGYTSGTLSVIASLNCGFNSAPRTITISSTPGVPGIMSGPSYVCPGSTASFSVPAVTGAASYNWTCSVPGAVVTPSGTSCSILFPAAIPAGSTVCVSAVSSCGNASGLRCKGITNGIPGTPGNISGPTAGQCGQASVSYSVLPVSQATGYIWTVNNGATISGPNNLSSVSINFPSTFTTCTLSVAATNGCGTGLTRTLVVNGVSAQPGPITGNLSVCNGAIESYATGGSAGATSYNWTSPAGSTILNTPPYGPTIAIQWGATGGNVTVAAVNDCGTSPSRSLAVAVTCRQSQLSETLNPTASLYPNPTNDKTTVKFESSVAAKYVISVVDVTGRIIISDEVAAAAGINMHELDLTSVARGIYLVRLQTEKQQTEILNVTVQ